MHNLVVGEDILNYGCGCSFEYSKNLDIAGNCGQIRSENHDIAAAIAVVDHNFKTLVGDIKLPIIYEAHMAFAAQFLSLVGSLHCISITCLDVAFVVNKLSQHMQAPILRYIS